MDAPRQATANQIGALAGKFDEIYGTRPTRLAAAEAVLGLDGPLATFKALTAEQAGQLFGWLHRVERGGADPAEFAWQHEGVLVGTREHGTRSTYNRGCRCGGCRRANTDASRHRRQARRAGTQAGSAERDGAPGAGAAGIDPPPPWPARRVAAGGAGMRRSEDPRAELLGLLAVVVLYLAGAGVYALVAALRRRARGRDADGGRAAEPQYGSSETIVQ